MNTNRSDNIESPLVSPIKLSTDPTLNDFDLALTYLKKQPNKRSNSENYVIFRVMMQIKFFQELAQKFGKETVEICCSFLRYKCTQPGQVLFKQGEVGDAFYIIMRGTVGVNIRTYTQIEDHQPKNILINGEKNEKPTASPRLSRGSLSINLQQIQQHQSQQQSSSPSNKYSLALKQAANKVLLLNSMYRKSGEIKYTTAQIENQVETNSDGNEAFEEKVLLQPILQEVKILKTGDSFGELALLKGTKGSQRAATIISKELTYYAYLVREDFQNILKDKEQDKLDSNIACFSKCTLFQGLDDSELRTIFLYCQVKNVQKDHIIYKEDDPPDYFYIVKSGDFQILKSQQIKDKKDVSYYEDEQMPTQFKKYHGRAQKQTAISILSQGQYFGHIEILKKSPRKYTVQCISSHGELYTISTNDFLRKIYYHQKPFIKKRFADDRLLHSELYEKQDEKFKDINEQNSHLLLQNSYDKQYYDKILYYTQRHSVKLPTVLQSFQTPKKENISQLNISNPLHQSGIQHQQSSSSQKSILNNPIEQMGSPTSVLNTSRSRYSMIQNEKKRPDHSLSIQIFNKSQQDQTLQKVNNLFYQPLKQLNRELSENLTNSINGDSVSITSRRASFLDSYRQRGSIKQSQQSPFIDCDQNLTFSKQIEQILGPSKKQMRPTSLNLKFAQSFIKESSLKVEEPKGQKEMSSQQKILHQKLQQQIFTSNSTVNQNQSGKHEFLSPQPQKQSQLLLPLLDINKGSQTAKSRKKSLFIHLKIGSINEKEGEANENSEDLKETAKKDKTREIQNVDTTNNIADENQNVSLLNTNSFYSHIEGKDKLDLQSQSPNLESLNQSKQIVEDYLKLDELNDEITKNLINKYETQNEAKKQINFHRKLKTLSEQQLKQNHQKLYSEMHNIQEEERQKKQLISESAIQVMNKMDGYRELKQKLESIRLAVEAKSERGVVTKESKKEILSRFFSFMKNQDTLKVQNKKVDRFKFTDFRNFEKIIQQKACTIKAHHQLRKSQILKQQQQEQQQQLQSHKIKLTIQSSS